MSGGGREQTTTGLIILGAALQNLLRSEMVDGDRKLSLDSGEGRHKLVGHGMQLHDLFL
jgi:hypothetical protein